ncbi:MAG: Three-deoxy-D-manno-octulosonic-acid transferase domain protein [Deltaproteobacteria bacterium]|nr:Three-deoxy-D-manno-octulosonic-acid transferase domain protein [Deltaproteobacteria bacterium]
MFYLSYNLLSLFLLVPVLLFTIYRSAAHKWPLALPARFGFISREELSKLHGRPVILLHAVSVGETIAARPLITAIRERYPHHALVVSTSTDTGRQTASATKEIDLCIYFPFDFLPSVRHIFTLLKPCVVIIMETEIWPNFTREAAQRSIPLILANGRISDRSFPRYLKLRWFFRHALQNFTMLCMQSETARERIIAIGAPVKRVVVCGNLKYDIPFHRVTLDEKRALRLRFTIPEECLVISAGSTHAGEEELILHAYRELLTDRDNLFLVLAPRHPQRCAEIGALLEKSGISFRRLSELKPDSGEMFRSGELLLVDSVGELMNLYALSDLAFVGGSLEPVGGHNLLEPASRGIPFVFGPHMANFSEITALVLENRAGIQVATPSELARTLRRLIDDPGERQLLGEYSLAMMRDNGGSTEKHMRGISGLPKLH